MESTTKDNLILSSKTDAVRKSDLQREAKASELEKIHSQIQNCRVCEQYGLEINKPHFMDRGKLSPIMVIGIAPGITEIKTGRAFSGQAGQRLLKWFGYPAIGEENIRRYVYFTSLIKCLVATINSKILRNCLPFLIKQIEVIHPQIIVTLGAEPLRILSRGELTLKNAIGYIFPPDSRAPQLIKDIAADAIFFPLPHPSGANRWLNVPENRIRLMPILAEIRKKIQAGGINDR